MSTAVLDAPVVKRPCSQLEQASRAREQMMAIVSHDLKNPLSTIQLAVRFLLEELTPDDDSHRAGRDQLRVIQRSSERMYRLVHDLLDVAAVEAGQMPINRTAVGVDELVDDAFELLRPLAVQKRIVLVSDHDPRLPAVAADRDRILQVFSNLGGNAFKHTPEGGRVEVTAVRQAAAVEFSVSDTGPGIAGHDLPYVFDRFWQASRRARSGVGLGLAIVKGIIEAHGGEVWAESQIGQGSRFTFTLPLAGASAAA